MPPTKKELRSERAKARRQRRQMQQWALIAIAAVILFLIIINVVDFGGSGSDAEAFLTFPISDAEIITTATGLQYQDVELGSGREAQPGDTVSVNYSGWLTDGTMFDSSLNPGRTPFDVVLGSGGVILGWEEGLLGMQEGGIRILTIPSDLGYGPGGSPPTIPPNATLIFRVEILEIK
jgi:FKBP-type peptidyl-prolyl cis-trans isomerase FkpA